MLVKMVISVYDTASTINVSAEEAELVHWCVLGMDKVVEAPESLSHHREEMHNFAFAIRGIAVF